ncbi:hypothetical protein PGTUg99_000646 [Puccinia graminis f. sp. tritici]|uniref:Uncharacterized protein n=1 Tax=Puccinia graminis f. sp. tritici TaxID=56615 RepID=A0A5B0R6Z5_PUCGR|nr:hypothetical protein PGTUg99_000646 [Puccinia graminis f. sp. tritici]
MNPSSHTQPAGSALPDDIRLKCSYYASEIKNQVSSLYDEQHKWLEDHLSEIKETLTKVTEKKQALAVMAGIIKTPSRKRTKRVSKKMSKPDQSSSTHPLSELKRSNLNINSKDIQEIINQQLEKEREKELSSLDHPYESPVKKTAGSSNFISADLTNKQPVPSIWNPVDSILPSKIVLSSGLSGSTKTNEDNIFSLSSSSNKKVDHKIPLLSSHSVHFLSRTPNLKRLNRATSPQPILTTCLLQLVTNCRLFKKERRRKITILPSRHHRYPNQLSTQSTSEVVPPQKLTSSTRLTHSVSASPTHKKLTTPPPQTKTTPTPPQCKSTTPPPQARSPHPQHASANIENLEARVSHSAKTPDIDNLPGSVSQVATTKLTDLRTSNTKPTPAPLDLLPSNSTAPSTISNVSSAAVNKLLTPEHPASDPASKPTSSASNSEQSQSNHIERFHSSSSHNPTAPMIKQESDEQAQQLPPQEAVPTLPHVDTVVEVPLSDKPSSLRNNLYASIGSSHSDKLPDHQVRTPGEPTGSNLFTPGNPRSAMIRSPHSQWSSKPSGALWTQHKPLKTPAALSNLATAAQSERNKGGLSGSPFEDLSKPVNLLSNLQSTSVQQSAVG